MDVSGELERIAFEECEQATVDIPADTTLRKDAVLQLMKVAFMRGYSACSEHRDE
jgi:hypothetical protein